jgi:hypothetical protein
VTLALAPVIDTYAAPVGMMAGLLPPSAYLFIRSQRGPDRISFPYREVGTALAIAVVVGGVYVLLIEALPLAAEVPAALALGLVYVGLLFWWRVVPETHWEALSHMVRSLVSGRPDRFSPRVGLRGLDQAERDALRAAVEASWAGRSRPERVEAAGHPANGDPAQLTGFLRTAGERGGVPVGAATDRDGEIGEYLFSSEPTAVRNAAMRRLLGEGTDPADLRALEDLVSHLATVPDAAWAGRRKSEDASGAGR